MNSGDEILRIQNEDESVELLAAQRAMYSEAKRRGRWSTALSLGVPLLMTIAQLFLPVPYELLVACSLVVFVLGLATARGADALKKEAASVQQAFDSRVYGVDFENSSFRRREMRRFARRVLDQDGEGAGLSGWYTSSIAGMEPCEAVSECQHENAMWTDRLLRRYLCLVLAASLAVAAVVVAAIVLLHAKWQGLFFLLAIAEWAIGRVGEVLSAQKAQRELARAIEDFNLSDCENIAIVQEKLYACRSTMVLVPDWLYALFRERDERELGA